MKSNVTTNIVVTLVLSHDEAEWLHNNMQNPLHGQAFGDESKEDGDMRQKFFEATKPPIVL